MPELPDIEVFARNLKKQYAGKRLLRIKVVHEKNIKDTQKQLSAALNGQVLTDIYRSGKELRLRFSNGAILGIHLMLTGDIIPFEGSNELKSTKVEFYFEDGKSLALTDRMKNAFVTLNPTDKAGIDALDPKLNYAYLKKALSKKAAVKKVLTDQNIIRGIGNSYSDEILWHTGIAPFCQACNIPDHKIKELGKNIKKVLKTATEKIHKHYPEKINGEVKEFLDIHTKTKEKSPTGAVIKRIDKGSQSTFYTEEQEHY